MVKSVHGLKLHTFLIFFPPEIAYKERIKIRRMKQ